LALKNRETRYRIPSIAKLGLEMSIMEESYSKKSINSNSYDDGEDSLESLLSCKSVNIFTDQEGIEKVWKLIIEQNEMKKDAEFSINGMGEQITEL
jgi:hypothetical protein